MTGAERIQRSVPSVRNYCFCSDVLLIYFYSYLVYPDMFAAAYSLCEAYSYYLFERDENGDYVVYGDAQATATGYGLRSSRIK